ncbi:hypothetical protein RQP46_007587 [Phenoliferia psychrophenolica]
MARPWCLVLLHNSPNMAKSLKSKSMRQFRKIKRDDPKSAFRVAEDARLARLSSKLSASLAKPKELTDKEEYLRKQDGYEEIEPVEGSSKDMEVEGEKVEGEGEDVKVSTSGPRMSRRESYRAHKGFQIRMKPKTLFRGKGEGKSMGCKPQRRR